MLCTLADFIIFYSSDDVLMYSYFPEILSYAICSTASVNPSGYFDSWLEINSSVETRKKYDGPFDGLTIYSSFIDKFAPFLLKSFFSFQLLTTVYSRFPRCLCIFFFANDENFFYDLNIFLSFALSLLTLEIFNFVRRKLLFRIIDSFAEKGM